jgi:hypothetical protein
MKKVVLILFIPLTTLFTFEARAQSCLENLNDASRAYYNGSFQAVIDLLSNCDYSAIEQNSRTEILELLIKAHLLRDNERSADSLMNSLLLVNPLYQPMVTDILIYRELYDSYTMINRFNFGFTAGFNIPNFKIIKYQSISSVTREPLNYTSQPGLHLGLNGEIIAIQNLYFNLGITYENFGYTYSEIILEYQQLDVGEQMNILRLPISLRYELPIGKFKPFVRVGIANHFLINSNLDLDLRAIPTDVLVPYAGIPYKTNGYDVSFQRKSFTLNYLLGFGLRRTIGTYQVELAVNYELGGQNLINTEERYNDENLLNTYFYVPDDIRLSNVRISFGIYKGIFKPKKN